MEAWGEKIGQGRTADVYALGEDRIVKVFRQPQLLEFEWTVAECLDDSSVPRPRVYGRQEQDGMQGIVYERIQGPTMMAQLAARPEEVEAFGRLLARLHAELHKAGAGRLPSHKEVLAHGIRRSRALLTEHRERAVLRLLESLPEGMTLCHGDFHPDNVMYGQQGPVVIDWMTATRGMPAADAARTLMLLRHAELPEEMPEPVQQAVKALRARLLGAYEAEYLRLSGVSKEELASWEAPLMAARLGESVPERECVRLLELIDERLG
ncbi:phosphotransferase [Paenibacillus filicis]|uniref:Phosphotransferase n=1 Tax=Paenibacillus gyeongsangnamensis TaxID=3388067 RepID=A0ABT4Q7A9_9BACL|nr:phosphotransferase [Paenibacillus filicis]MCZ8512760.1 phosphotransferase [Paenibacillus filicis]